jgi:predicted transcriptional regulator
VEKIRETPNVDPPVEEGKEANLVTQEITISLPESLYLRLQQVAQGTKQSVAEVIVRAVQIGSPPSWEEAPAEFQADLAALDRLDDDTLWRIARSHQLAEDMARYQDLLDKNADGTLSPVEWMELTQLGKAADRFMLRKAYAVDLLRWRGHVVPPAHQLKPLP